MKTIKVIDLLNKIVNGEEVPNIIIVEEDKYYYNKDLKEYINQRTGEKLFEDGYGKFLKYYLNDEVEIIEEPRDIEVCGSLFTKSKYDDLQQRIDKAIEYIENNQLYEDLTDYSEEEINFIFVNDFKATKELLSILRGDDK